MCSNEYFCNFFFVEIQKSFLETISKLILKYTGTFICVCRLYLKFFFRQNIFEVDSIRVNPGGKYHYLEDVTNVFFLTDWFNRRMYEK
jgi:hypothetical protein